MGALFGGGQGIVYDDEAYLWPCNVDTWNHWANLQTQWRVGMGGQTGLDYAGVRAYMDECGLAGDERKEVFSGVRAAEQGCLLGWQDRKKNESAT